MSVGSNQFRGSAVGGFRRQDVLSYLVTMEESHKEALEALRNQLEECQKAREEEVLLLHALEARAATAGEVHAALEENLAQVTAQRDEAQEALKAARGELAGLQAMMAELRPKAAAYQRLKSRTGTIELEAQERAQMTLDRAEEDATGVRESCVNWLREVQLEYERLRFDLNATFLKSNAELDKISQSFDEISGEFDQHSDVLLEILNAAEEVGAKAPDPAEGKTV